MGKRWVHSHYSLESFCEDSKSYLIRPYTIMFGVVFWRGHFVYTRLLSRIPWLDLPSPGSLELCLFHNPPASDQGKCMYWLGAL